MSKELLKEQANSMASRPPLRMCKNGIGGGESLHIVFKLGELFDLSSIKIKNPSPEKCVSA